MLKVEEYKQNAKQCRALVALVTRPKEVALEEIAKAWEEVAAFRERELHQASVIPRESAAPTE
jgi:hypothetical protein